MAYNYEYPYTDPNRHNIDWVVDYVFHAPDGVKATKEEAENSINSTKTNAISEVTETIENAEARAEEAKRSIERKGADTLETIPSDYTTIANGLTEANNNIRLLSELVQLNSGVEIIPLGIGSYISTAGGIADTNKYAYCLKVNTHGHKVYLKSEDTIRCYIRGLDGAWIAGIDSTYLVELPDSYGNSVTLEISDAHQTWGTVYTLDTIKDVLKNIHICEGAVNTYINPVCLPYVTETGAAKIATYGDWATYKVHLNRGDVIKVYCPYSSTAYPTIYEYIGGVFTTILAKTAQDYTHSYCANADKDIYIQLSTKFGSNYLDPARFYLESKYKDKSTLDGLHLCCIGDSYIANNGINPKYTWCDKIAKKFGMKYTNLGISGGGLCGVRNDITPVKDRYTEIPADADIIILEGGENDANISYDISRFKTQFENLVLAIKGTYYSSTLLIMCPWGDGDTSRSYIKPYADAMREVATKYGVPFFDSWNQYIYNQSSGARGRWYQANTDSSHLNNNGHNVFMPMMEHFIESVL